MSQTYNNGTNGYQPYDEGSDPNDPNATGAASQPYPYAGAPAYDGYGNPVRSWLPGQGPVIHADPTTGHAIDQYGNDVTGSQSILNPGSSYTPSGNVTNTPYTASTASAGLTASQPAAPSGIPSTGRTMDDASILAQIQQWAAMPQADPSLAQNPQYWLGRIKDTGGLGSDNLPWWQNAGVGPNAFYLNPNREAGTPTTVNGTTMLAGTVDTSQNTQFTNTFRQALLDQLQKLTDPSTLGVNSPDVQPAIQANHLTTQRGLEDTRNALAEAAYAGGNLNTGGYQASQQKALEDAAANEANFAGNAVSNQATQRQAMLSQLLGLGGNFITQGNALGQNANQFASQLGYDYANLAQQKDLAGASLGYNYAALQNAMNRDALLASLGYYGG